MSRELHLGPPHQRDFQILLVVGDVGDDDDDQIPFLDQFQLGKKERMKI